MNMGRTFQRLFLLLAWLSIGQSAIIPALNPIVAPFLDTPISLEKREPAPYSLDTQFELIGFSPEYQNVIKLSAIGVIAMAGHAMHVLDLPENSPVPTNPSFLRYFPVQSIDDVKRTLQTLLAVLGSPGMENAQGCLRVPKLQIWFDWHRLKPDECKNPNSDTIAAMSRDEQNKSYMMICNTFFANTKRFDQVNCAEVVTDGAVDMGLENEDDIPVFSGSITFMHELLHWNEVTIAAGVVPIIDAEVTRPDNHERTVAYRAFYAMQMLNPGWLPSRPAAQNADNFVFMVLELFYGAQCPNVLPWSSPPDSRLEFPPL